MLINSIKRSSKNQDIKKVKKSISNADQTFSIEEHVKQSDVTNIDQLDKINPFLSLQEMQDNDKEIDAMKKHGNEILGVLDSIRFALIQGNFKESDILHLKKLINNKQQFFSPEIQSIMNNIMIRAEVELAKLESVK